MATVSGSSVTSLSTSTSPRAQKAEELERRTRQIGRELFEQIGRGPSPWQGAWWDDRLMNWTLNDPQVRVQLFRFIDALPSFNSAVSVRRHLAEYLAEAGDQVPWWLKLAVALAPAGSDRETLLAWSARSAAGVMAQKFIAGATPDQATRTVLGLRERSLAFTADLLGEAVISEAEADVYQQTCLELIRGLAGPLQEGSRKPADRPRPARPDSAGQPLAQAVELDDPFRRHPYRGHARKRGWPAAADPANGPRAGGLCSCGHGAILLAGPHLRDFPADSRRARVPRLAGCRDRRPGLSAARPRPSCSCC